VAGVPDRVSDLAGRARLLQQLPIVRPSLTREYGLMAERLRFETNDPRLLAAADAAFGRFPVPDGGDREPLVVRLVSEAPPTGGDREPSVPSYHSQGNLLLIGGGGGVASVDVDRGVAVGVVTPDTARNLPMVRYRFVEAMALSMLSRARGYVTLHAAGVVRDGVGIVLLGPAGAGKSTLAMACARRGFGVLAEDAVFVREAQAGVELWGLPWVQRLLPDATLLFPELARLEPRPQANGETKLEVDLDDVLPGRAVPCAPAGPIVVLERPADGGGGGRVEVLDESAAMEAVEVQWPYDGGWSEAHERTVARLLEGGVYRLRNGASPDAAVDAIEALLAAARR
jgi:hypothetical protein